MPEIGPQYREALVNALYSSAKEHCPRMIALDEAFVGIDELYKPELFGLAVKFDLDLFMTGTTCG
jgi:hypothetical protein